MFCLSMKPSPRRASRIPPARSESVAASAFDRYPNRETFFGCCAVAAVTATTSTKGITETPAHFRFLIFDFRLTEQESGKRIQDRSIMLFSLNRKSAIENLKLNHL